MKSFPWVAVLITFVLSIIITAVVMILIDKSKEKNGRLITLTKEQAKMYLDALKAQDAASTTPNVGVAIATITPAVTVKAKFK